MHDGVQLLDVVRIEPQHQAEAAAQRRAHQALARGRADGGELRHRDGVRARARARADQDVDAEILQRRIQHLFDIGQQPVDLVDEEDLARADVAEDAGEVELLLQHGPEVWSKATSSSSAMMVARVVLPSPGGP